VKATEPTSAAHLLFTLVGLLLLAALSLSLRFAHLGGWGMPVALAIALAKAGLILVFFMEILGERTTVRLAFTAGVSLFVLMLLFIVADVVTRSRPPFHPPGTAERSLG
jgi:cytochrome c oxidase subunit 4